MATQKALGGGTVKVRATQVGFYGEVRRRIGDVFSLVPRTGTFSEQLKDPNGELKTLKTGTPIEHPITKEVAKVLTAEEQFSPRWMEKVAANTPVRAVTAAEVLQDEHDRVLKQRMTGASTSDLPPTGDDEVL